MSTTKDFTRKQLAVIACFSTSDLTAIRQRRRLHNPLGFGYQLAFVRLMNRFPAQIPFEINEEVLTFAAPRLNISEQNIQRYQRRQPSVSEHQEAIRQYLGLREFKAGHAEAEAFVFDLAAGLEQTSALMAQLRRFLKEQHILEPAADTLQRIIQTERERARTAIYTPIGQLVTLPVAKQLDALLNRGEHSYTQLYYLKRPPGQASPAAFIKLSDRLEVIQATGILALDLSWLNNNLQRSLARYARSCSTYRLRNLTPVHRYTVRVCFPQQLYQDTFDAIVQMYDKLMTKVYNKANNEVALYLKKRRRQIHTSLSHYNKIPRILLNIDIQATTLRTTIYAQVDQATLETEQAELQSLLSNKHYDIFNRVVVRHGYLRQFSPALLKHLKLKVETSNQVTNQLLKAVRLLKKMNQSGKPQIA